MDAIASQITSLTIVYSIVYSVVDQRKHQSSTSLAFVGGINRGPANSPHKWPVTRKMFPFDEVIMPLWCHDMETYSILLGPLCVEYTGAFPHTGPVMRTFGVFLKVWTHCLCEVTAMILFRIVFWCLLTLVVMHGIYLPLFFKMVWLGPIWIYKYINV